MSVFVCDGCMRHVEAKDVDIWADFEHVLCRRCTQLETDRSTESLHRPDHPPRMTDRTDGRTDGLT